VGIFNLLTILVTNQYQLLAVRLTMGVLSGFGATALVGSVAPKEKLGYALGLLGAGQTVGVVFGPLLGGVISSYFASRRLQAADPGGTCGAAEPRPGPGRDGPVPRPARHVRGPGS
jgi:MFS family permease